MRVKILVHLLQLHCKEFYGFVIFPSNNVMVSRWASKTRRVKTLTGGSNSRFRVDIAGGEYHVHCFI